MARHSRGSISPQRSTAAAMPSTVARDPTGLPRPPTISGTEPRGVAITGTPQAMASTITSPNGSSQAIGLISACAPCSRRTRSRRSISPTYSIPPPRSGRTSCSKYACSAAPRSLPASSSGMPAARATSIAVTGPLSADMRPSQKRYSPPRLARGRVVVELDRIRDRRGPGQVARSRAVALGQRDERRARSELADAPVERARLARRASRAPCSGTASR